MARIKFSQGGYDYITRQIDDALKKGKRKATVKGFWILDRAVRIPSDFTLVLKNCYLRLSDSSYTNMFINEHHGTEIGKSLAGTDKNIGIVGEGFAILDGGKYNGLSEKTQCKDGLPPVWKNNLILFTNVTGFKISGIHCRNQRWWALNFVYCSNGYIGDVDFLASYSAIDADGREYKGLSHSKYSEVLVKNADGIDIRCGCHDIVIENITGFTEDDTVAVTGLLGELEREFAVEGLACDISDIIVKNVRSAAFCTNVRLLNQGGVRLHDIYVDGVYDVGRNTEYMDKGLYAVRIGDTRLYGARHSTADETYNISVKNVHGCGLYALALAGSMRNLVTENITADDGTGLILDERTV